MAGVSFLESLTPQIRGWSGSWTAQTVSGADRPPADLVDAEHRAAPPEFDHGVVHRIDALPVGTFLFVSLHCTLACLLNLHARILAIARD